MQIISIVGARPQFIKHAPVSRAMGRYEAANGVNIEDVIVHTGQHYDHAMSEVFFEELEIPKPTVELNVGSAAHGMQTGKMLQLIEKTLVSSEPDLVLIYGDTNSTLAGALAAAKLDIPIAHVEAGLRSFNREMPEEINRLAADHISDLLLAPTQTAMDNLHRENLASRSVNTGDVMLDAVLYNASLATSKSTILADLGLSPGGYAVATLHRASNTSPEKLIAILTVLNDIAANIVPIVFPAHPRTIAVLGQSDVDWEPVERLSIIDPVGYLDMLQLLENAAVAMTDSGGLQKEALFLGTPCVTLREETEWLETVSAGWNILAGSDSEAIREGVETSLASDRAPSQSLEEARSAFGHGRASELIVEALVRLGA